MLAEEDSESYYQHMNYQDIITIEPGKRGGKPCIRGMRITVYDVLEYLAFRNVAGRSPEGISLSNCGRYSRLPGLCR
jgi:uncharacterized protein (DUF433 family)